MNKHSTIYVGLDLGDKHSYIAILDQDGELIEETRLPSTKASFHQRFSMLPPCRVAMEVSSFPAIANQNPHYLPIHLWDDSQHRFIRKRSY